MNAAQLFLLSLPLLLTFSCRLVFAVAGKEFGSKTGYLTGFVFYWMVWCTAIPLLLVGPSALSSFFKPSTVFDWKIILCLIPLLVFVYVYAFPKALRRANIVIVVASLLLAIINATLEEVLWRATYLLVFGNATVWSVLFASIGFALWHYAPQVVVANKHPGGAHSFVLFALVLGLCYAYVAWQQQSIYWTTLTHIAFDFAGLGALFYFK